MYYNVLVISMYVSMKCLKISKGKSKKDSRYNGQKDKRINKGTGWYVIAITWVKGWKKNNEKCLMITLTKKSYTVTRRVSHVEQELPKKDSRYNGQKGKRINNDLQNITQKTKDRATQIPLRNQGWTQVLRIYSVHAWKIFPCYLRYRLITN
jgi:hypothetical protein